MSPLTGILLMMNNYFHDVATALLLASGVTMWIIVKRFGNNEDKAVIGYFLDIYQGVTRLAKFALVWIFVGGIPRVIAYKEFEWANAAGKSQIPALIIKHILFFAFVGTGAYFWMKISKRVKKLKDRVRTAL